MQSTSELLTVAGLRAQLPSASHQHVPMACEQMSDAACAALQPNNFYAELLSERTADYLRFCAPQTNMSNCQVDSDCLQSVFLQQPMVQPVSGSLLVHAKIYLKHGMSSCQQLGIPALHL